MEVLSFFCFGLFVGLAVTPNAAGVIF